MPSPKSIAEQSAVKVPLYTYLDAVRYLRLPFWLTLSASGCPPYHPMEFFEWFWPNHHFRNRITDDFGPTLGDEEPARISFNSLASIFVSTAVLRPFFSPHPKKAMHFFKGSHESVRRLADDSRLFTDPEWVLSRFDLVSDRLSENDKTVLLKLVALHQARVELRDGVPVQLFPFSRDPSPDVPRSVVIDPELRFGRPTVKGAPTDILAERWRAGDSPSELAEDYGLTTDEVDEALRYEASPHQPHLLHPLTPFGW